MYLPERKNYFQVPDNFLINIFDILKKYPIKNILDLGSGRTTIFFNKYCSYANIYSIENDDKYINKDYNIYKVDAVVNEDESYYNNDQLFDIIGDIKFDLISIDGPIGYKVNHPRQNILQIIDNKLLNDEYFIFLHDTDRLGEQWLINKIFEHLKINNYDFDYKFLDIPHGAILIYHVNYQETILCPCCNHISSKNDLTYIGNNSSILDKYYLIGAGLRKTVCPYCYSNDRSRLIYSYLKSFDFTNKNILHVAPENEISILFDKANLYERICNFSEPYDSYSNNLKNVDLCDMSCYDDNTFDFIICNHVLEHVIDDNLALLELHRVLKKNGILIMQVPLAIGLENTLYKNECILDDPSHKRLYGDNYQTYIEKYGFISEKVYLADKLKNCGLNPLEYINIFRNI